MLYIFAYKFIFYLQVLTYLYRAGR